MDHIDRERRTILAARVWVTAARSLDRVIPDDWAELAARPLPDHGDGPPTARQIHAARIILTIDELNDRESAPDVVAMAGLPLPTLSTQDS